MMVGRILELNRKRSISITLQGGPGISTSREPEFSLEKSGNQYNFKTSASKNFSLVLNPKLEMPICYSIGCSVGPVIIVNGKSTFVGAGIGLMYGIIKK
ncbi:MAG TPA: hypothetical protein VEP89_12255 [Draconibacterium sp.]|nr:hypothetical protein [Draconibacterium sp.]